MDIHSFIAARLDEIEYVSRFERNKPGLMFETYVLIDLDMKRAVNERHSYIGKRLVATDESFPRASEWQGYCMYCQQTAPCITVRLIAAPFKNHSDYNSDWAAPEDFFLNDWEREHMQRLMRELWD